MAVVLPVTLVRSDTVRRRLRAMGKSRSSLRDVGVIVSPREESFMETDSLDPRRLKAIYEAQLKPPSRRNRVVARARTEIFSAPLKKRIGNDL